MTTRALAWRLVLTGVAVALITSIGGFGLAPPGVAEVIDNGAQLVAGLTAILACWWTSRRQVGVDRQWRRFMAWGLVGWSTGQVIWSWHQIVEDTPLPTPSLADVGYLVLPIFGLLALIALTGDQPAGPASRPGTWLVIILDGLIVVISLFGLAWTTVLFAVVHARAPTFLAYVVAIAYPITDLLLVVIVILLAVTRRVAEPHRRQLFVLGLGLVSLSISDSIFAYIVTMGVEEMPIAANAGFIAGPALVAVAAFTPTGPPVRTEITPRRSTELWYLLLPYLPVAAIGTVIVVEVAQGRSLTAFEIYLGWFVAVLLLARQMITLLENTVLLERVSEGQRRTTYQALHDPLTGLANRRLLTEQLARALEVDSWKVALLFVDLDDFKMINDSLGHAAGDRLLELVGARLRACVRETDVVARLGGDEFAILVTSDVVSPQRIGERILAALREPFTLDGRTVALTASVGIASPDAGPIPVTLDALLRRADAAMYAGKARGKGELVHYRADFRHGLNDPDLPSYLADSLRGDPCEGGFTVVYQPIVRVADEETVAVEALARWSHPIVGPVGPDIFIPMAERAGLVSTLDNYVLNQACQDLAALRQHYGQPINLHVNISAPRLGLEELESAIAEAVDQYAVPSNALVLEVTETGRIGDLAEATASVRRLRNLGARIALDDFGAGYNALAQLHSLPVDIVKLDHELTHVDPDVRRAEALCRSILSICAPMGVTVIAEGIETADQKDMLTRLGVEFAQGYLYARPTPLPKLRTARR